MKGGFCILAWISLQALASWPAGCDGEERSLDGGEVEQDAGCEQTCLVAEDCQGDCLKCVDGCCQSYACESDDDCSPEACMLCLQSFEDGCHVCMFVRCGNDDLCRDPASPFYIECQDGFFPVMRGCPCYCKCEYPCFGECPEGTYCCLATNTCDPVPEPCPDTTCPEGEQVNPEPGGNLNEETCEVEGADCYCTPLP